MRMRPYIHDEDYMYVSRWIDNEKVHAFWCANRLPYPITAEIFHDFLIQNAMEWTDSAFVATEDNGHVIGFFCYSLNTENNTGFLKFIIVDNLQRRKGYGKEMLRLALQYAFQITGAEAVQLNVFEENTLAKHLYETVGFTERHIDKNVFPFNGTSWSRCNMIITRQQFMTRGA